MQPHIRKRIIRTVLLGVIAFVVAAGISWLQMQSALDDAQMDVVPAGAVDGAHSVGTPASSPLPGVKIGGDFTLANHRGETVTNETFAGQYKLLYFGFTYCPDVCPAELRNISAALNRLPAAAMDQIQPLFVTIDPARDTVNVMAEYVALFHPKLVGLTGPDHKVSQMADNYRVFYSKVPPEDPDDQQHYLMNHSSFTYFMSPEDELLITFPFGEDPDKIAAKIQELMGGAS